MATTAATENGTPDPDVVRRFHFTREMVKGPVYRKYKFAINRVWNVDDLDFTQDAADWQRLTPDQQRGLLGVTVRFLAGEQAVTDELVPMLAASHALGRFDCGTARWSGSSSPRRSPPTSSLAARRSTRAAASRFATSSMRPCRSTAGSCWRRR
jgi:hypothetical protein